MVRVVSPDHFVTTCMRVHVCVCVCVVFSLSALDGGKGLVHVLITLSPRKESAVTTGQGGEWVPEPHTCREKSLPN
jgi:hypothetical protein